ncbi:hypothetical protein VTN77DRAFT_6538 [Rasamsonia byssochlamydoides]|uniref:uncharacterized protein n=1 Tax=Rasamsonia byssochlamydoides TaxID=89139 RepID=UPI0037431F1C
MEDNAELESFRRQWREEVSRRTKAASTSKPPSQPSVSSSAREEHFPPTRHEVADRKEDAYEEDFGQHNYGEFVQQVGQLSLQTADEDTFQRAPQREPRSALEHFEKAVQKEAEGNLGDSLSHYRKAYRLDSSVDQTYRKKHFGSSKAPPSKDSNLSAATAKDTPDAREEGEPLSTPELILSFANLPIPQAEPLIENTPPPPCPISKVPSDVLIEILKHVALMDPASFCRMALVCKRFAYHFAHEQHIWKSLCQGRKFGFAGMHYSFGCDVTGNPLHTLGPRFTPFPRGVPVQIPKPLSTWSQVFQTFPRIRFTGIYISTVNYTRPGAASSCQNITWNSPIHIVTYYRYLRFYPDGSVISLLTTTEPTEVVPYISKENMAAARATNQGHHQHQRQKSESGSTGAVAQVNPVPATAMATLKHALRGRWHLIRPAPANPDEQTIPEQSYSGSGPPSIKTDATSGQDPRDLVVETEGVDPKYTYTLHLSLRSTNSARHAGSNQPPPNVSKNTRLIWKGFWSYNKLTDDWAEFGLRNDRAFVFRRVRDWGME